MVVNISQWNTTILANTDNLLIMIGSVSAVCSSTEWLMIHLLLTVFAWYLTPHLVKIDLLSLSDSTRGNISYFISDVPLLLKINFSGISYYLQSFTLVKSKSILKVKIFRIKELTGWVTTCWIFINLHRSTYTRTTYSSSALHSAAIWTTSYHSYHFIVKG